MPPLIYVNTKPVGTERKRADGYIWVKIAEPNTWKEKHVLLYESVHGNEWNEDDVDV